MTLPSPGPTARPSSHASASPRARSPRRGSSPLLSVVVASRSERHVLQGCLESLIDQCQRSRAEIVVARSAHGGDTAALAKLYPSVVFVEGPDTATVAELRSLGMNHSVGDIVALIEDDRSVHEGWLESITPRPASSQEDGDGRIRHEFEPTAFAAYGFGASPGSTALDEGVAGGEAAGNGAYGLRVMGDLVEWVRETHGGDDRGRFAEGSAMRFAETATLDSDQAHTLGDLCADRFARGRDYALERLSADGTTARWLHVITTPFLPVVLTWRLGGAVSPARRWAFARALPAALVFFAAWAVGEGAGYLRGQEPHRSGS